MKVYTSPEGYIEKLRQDAMKEGRKPIPVCMDLGGGLFISAEVPQPGPKNPNESDADYMKRVAICEQARKDIEEARKDGAESTELKVVPPALEAEFEESLRYKAEKAKAAGIVNVGAATEPAGAPAPAQGAAEGGKTAGKAKKGADAS